MSNVPSEAENELEAFRRRWREEVQSRNTGAQSTADSTSRSDSTEQKRTQLGPQTVATAGPSKVAKRDAAYYAEEIEPRVYHDLPDKEEALKLGDEGQNHDRHAIFREPKSALEHYERAVEKETQGMLGDSVKHYRKAFKLDDGVHEQYKRKYFPPSAFKSKPTNPNPSNAPVTVPNPAHHSLHGSVQKLLEDFAGLRIEPPPPATDASPLERSYFGELPDEILTQVLTNVAFADVASFARLTQVCKRLAYLVMTEESIWRQIALGQDFGFRSMFYDFPCDIQGDSHQSNDEIARYLNSYDDESPDTEVKSLPATPEERWLSFIKLSESLLPAYSSSWREMFRSRPRVRFNGCYISTVNYTRPGAQNNNTLTWGVPVHVVTYFRYLRFFRDGTVISLLTTAEPADVVHHLTKANLHDHHGNVLPSSVMKDALRGRWRLSGPSSSIVDPVTGERETEGEVHVDTEGVVPKYTYHMLLALSHAGKGARNNKLAWKGFWSHNRLTDDLGEFGLKNDKAFYWSRVKSYGLGY